LPNVVARILRKVRPTTPVRHVIKAFDKKAHGRQLLWGLSQCELNPVKVVLEVRLDC